MADDSLSIDEKTSRSEEMTQMLVHDLKGPAGEIIANIQMLESYVADEFGKDILSTASVSADHLLVMIQDILDVAKIEDGKLELVKEPFDLVALLKEKAEGAGPVAQAGEKTITFISPMETCEIEADRKIIGRVVWNLLSNAQNHTYEGGQITLELALEDGKRRITVGDNGAGISPGIIDHIFDKFYQPKGAMMSVKYSSGLGLTFCKMAVEAHGGSIVAESKPGKGSRFHVYLP